MALFLTTAVGWAQTTFFTDNFSNGSTTNLASVRGGTPAASFTSYDIGASKTTIGYTTVSPNDLRLTLNAATGSGYVEAQAMFATNGSPVVLTSPGNDYIEVDIVFTNTGGSLLFGGAKSALWVGLYNSGGSAPLPGGVLANSGLTTTAGSPYATGNCANWQGYVGGMCADNDNTQTRTRPIQNGSQTYSADQELLGNNISGGTYNNPGGTAIETVSPTPTITLTSGATYTLDLTIWLTSATSMTISNTLYNGAGTGGTVLFSHGSASGAITNATFLTSSFDGLGFGVLNSSSPSMNPVMDISSITITGHSTVVSGPPTIQTQPTPLTVATNGYGQFSITAVGDGVTYQWYRNGAALSNGGDISGATASALTVYPAQVSDEFSSANGYYCKVSGAGGYSTNSVTNSLTLVPATNLTWVGTSFNGNWDVDTTPNWEDILLNPAVFTGGDSVNFNDANAKNSDILLIGNVAPSAMAVTTGSEFTFEGSGSIVGPGSVILNGNASSGIGEVILDSANSYTGGTYVTNGIYVELENLGGFGTGPLTLNNPSGDIEIVPTGSSSSGIQGQLNVNDDATFLIDGEGSFGLVFLSNLAGVSGKTLTLSPNPSVNPDTGSIRVRVYGGSTVFDANLALTDANILFASYAGDQTYNGVISGPGAFMEKGDITYMNGPNTYTGGTFPATGAIGFGVSSTGSSGPIGTGAILLAPDSTTTTTGSGMIFANAANISISNPIQYVSGTNNLTLEVGGSQNLTLAGPFTLYGNDHSAMTAFPTRTLNVTNTGLTILTGQINDGGSNYNFTLTGSGKTIFNNTEAWGGTTTNVGSNTNISSIMLVNGQVGPGAIVIQTNATLGGAGTITGPVTIQNGGTLAVDAQITGGAGSVGTLTINNSVTFSSGSTNSVNVEYPGRSADKFKGITSVTYAGTLVVNTTGGGAALQDTYQIFNPTSHSGTFANVLGSPGPGLAWSFNAANGSITVVQGIVPFTVPPHISTITFQSGTNLTITGTNAQSGALYYLLTGTNLLTPVSQWKPVGTNIAPGANNFSFNITNAVNPNDAQQYFIFSSTNN